MDELFGRLGAEKELEGVNYLKIKETKSKRALKTYEILSQYINFENTFIKFVTPILSKADSFFKSSSIKKLEEILAIISTNILKNSSVTAESLLIILFAIIKKGTTEENKLEEEEQDVEEDKFVKKREKALKYQTFKVLPHWQRDLSYFRVVDNELSKNMLLAFALSTIKKAMDVLPIHDYKDKLDAFTKLYVVLMKSTDNKVLVNTLHLLGK